MLTLPAVTWRRFGIWLAAALLTVTCGVATRIGDLPDRLIGSADDPAKRVGGGGAPR